MKTLAALIALALSSTAFSQQPDDAAAIDRLRVGLVESFNKQDIAGLTAHLSPDVVVTWQNGEVCHGPEEMRAYYQRMMTGEQRIVRELKTNPEILGRQMHGDWAISWGKLGDHFTLMDGSDLPLNSTFTATLQKTGNRWVVSAFHVSVNAFSNPIMKLAVSKTAIWTGGGALVVGLLGGFLFGRKSGREPDWR